MTRRAGRPAGNEGARPDPHRAAPVAPVASGPAARQPPERDVKSGAFDASVAGEEDPGAGVDTLTPRSPR